jgi:hypothetical protein
MRNGSPIKSRSGTRRYRARERGERGERGPTSKPISYSKPAAISSSFSHRPPPPRCSSYHSGLRGTRKHAVVVGRGNGADEGVATARLAAGHWHIVPPATFIRDQLAFVSDAVHEDHGGSSAGSLVVLTTGFRLRFADFRSLFVSRLRSARGMLSERVEALLDGLQGMVPTP